MKRVVRSNCFETNSSSMHSIVVTKDSRPFTEGDIPWEIEKYNRISFISEEDLEFGRSPFNVLSKLEDKIPYVIASYCSYKPREFCEDFLESLNNIIREEIPSFTGITLPKITREVFLDLNGKELVPEDVHWDHTDKNDEGERIDVYCYYDENDIKQIAKESGTWKDYPYYGCVDHQSMGILEGFLEKNNISIKDFLFGKRYVVIIDGDEYCIFDNLKEAGIINKDNIQMEYPEDSDFDNN